MSRSFAATKATRTAVPLLIGLYGPSGGGKTFSALRLAEGIRRVTGGRVKVIDTESGRAKYYADRFDFDHIPLDPPFGSLDYLQALHYAASLDAGPIVVDSGSHEHEGEGGLLMRHDAELERKLGPRPEDPAGLARWEKDAGKQNFSAWIKPKAERQRLINGILQLGRNMIWCFRAKEKLKVVPGGQPEAMGWMPIAGDEFVYEMTITGLLLPGAGGVPTWKPEARGEAAMIKLPEQFRKGFPTDRKEPLSEDDGEAMARWAAGSQSSGSPASTQSAAGASAPATTKAHPPTAATAPVDEKALEKARSSLWASLKPLGDSAKRYAWISDKLQRDVGNMAKVTLAEAIALTKFANGEA